jgi:hypothetical protein
LIKRTIPAQKRDSITNNKSKNGPRMVSVGRRGRQPAGQVFFRSGLGGFGRKL